MIDYLLDTNICIELIRSRSTKILKRLQKCRIGQVGISSITLAELEYGVYKSRDPQRNRLALIEFCAPLEILSFDDRAASIYGQIRTAIEKAGKPIGPLDTLIAAHALALDATLITNNQREFARVPKLHIENWL
jgi:tRNA(fMet)-specific endonuclease VapC